MAAYRPQPIRKQPPFTLQPTILYEDYSTTRLVNEFTQGAGADQVRVTRKYDVPFCPDQSDKERVVRTIHEFIYACHDDRLHIDGPGRYTISTSDFYALTLPVSVTITRSATSFTSRIFNANTSWTKFVTDPILLFKFIPTATLPSNAVRSMNVFLSGTSLRIAALSLLLFLRDMPWCGRVIHTAPGYLSDTL